MLGRAGKHNIERGAGLKGRKQVHPDRCDPLAYSVRTRILDGSSGKRLRLDELFAE